MRKGLKCTHLFLILTIILTQVLVFVPTSYAADTGNLALGKTMTANNYTQVYVASNANDGNVNTYWEGAPNAYPNTLTLDLGSAQSVYKVVLKLNASWGSRTQTLSLLSSTDNSYYTTRVASKTYTFNPSSANTVTITFAEASARYIRLNFTGNSGAIGGQVAEFEVYGTATATGNPDLIVTDISWNPDSPVAGNAVSFSATIKNQGTGASPAGVIHGVAFLVNGTLVNWSDTYTSSIAAGASVTVTANWGPNNKATWTAPSGSSTITAWIDDVNRITNESNENNNQYTETLIVGSSSTIAVPGTLEAENYSAMSGIQTESCSEGTLNVGWTDTGDWMDYTVNVASSGTYTVNARVASPNNNTSFKIQRNGTDLGTIAVPNTGGWQNWTTASTSVALGAGVQTLRVYISAGGLNINNINFVAGTTGKPDLVITDITYTPSSPVAGSAVTFSAAVKNQGTAAGSAGIVTFKVDNTQIASTNSTAVIAPGATAIITASNPWIAASNNHTFSATVDSSNTTVESNETNNSYSESMLVGGSNGDVVGKLYAGYQGWFNCAGDGSPLGGWNHWTTNSSAPNTNPYNLKFEIYPDIREYTNLYQTNLGNLGNGQPAKLFSSFDASTVNKHFEWMQTYNIDGAALQRFGASGPMDNWKRNRDSVAVKVKNAAESYGRKFYVMYDITGMPNDAWVSGLQQDWTSNVIGSMNLTASSAYAKQNGKPVVCIWGIGFTDRPGDAAQCSTIINWFKSQGCYVIGGVPTYWRQGINDSRPGFIDVYKSLNMISPWLVGRFGSIQGADDFKNNVIGPDYTYCLQNGIDYQPTMNPGFAWSNMFTDKPRNEAPRLHGDFMWRQAYNIKSLGISTGYIAMFDEYDEGTAIAKGAENSAMIPNNQYFLTYDADGVVCSSDFYLRLSGDINRLLKEQIPLTTTHPTSHQ